MRLLRSRKFWITLLKVGFLAFVSAMILVQVPELLYDLGPERPVPVVNSEDLSQESFRSATFVSVSGRPDFGNAFIYRRYGLSYTYFTVQPYGMRLIVRTHSRVTDEWRDLHRFLGKLRPFRRQPFHYRIRDIYQEKFRVTVPEDAFFLGLDDVPGINGWQIGALAFGSLLWGVMFYAFFLYRSKPSRNSHVMRDG